MLLIFHIGDRIGVAALPGLPSSAFFDSDSSFDDDESCYDDGRSLDDSDKFEPIGGGIDNWHMALARHRRFLSHDEKENPVPQRSKTPGPGSSNKKSSSKKAPQIKNEIADLAELPTSPFPTVDLDRRNSVTLQQILDAWRRYATGTTSSIFLGGKFLLCRSIAPTFENHDVNLLVDDPDGQLAAPVRLLNFGVDLPGSGFPCNSVDRSVPVGSILVLMNPIVVKDANSVLVLRCQNPAHFALLAPGHPLLDGVAFKANLPYPSEVPEVNYVFDHNANGEKFLALKNYVVALHFLNRAVEEKGEDLPLSYANRASAYLDLAKYDQALDDADKGLDLDPINPEVVEKLRISKAKSLFHLKNYQQCADFLEQNPVTDLNFRQVVETAIEESTFGRYDFTKIRLEKSPYLTSHADYFASDLLEPASLVAKRDIEPGVLLMANRAFAFSSTPRQVISIVFAKMSTDSVGAKLELAKMPRQPASFDNNVQLGGFIEDEALLSIDFFASSQNWVKGCGLWTSPPSRLKTSCNNANCARCYIGDFVFVHSVKKIAKGEQLATFKPPVDRLPSPFSDQRDACDCLECSMGRENSEKFQYKFGEAELVLQTQSKLLAPSSNRLTKTQLENGIDALVVALKGLRSANKGGDGPDRSAVLVMAKIRQTIGQFYAKLRDFKMATVYMEEAARGFGDLSILTEALRCADLLSEWFSQVSGKRGPRKSEEWRQRKIEYANLLCGLEPNFQQ